MKVLVTGHTGFIGQNLVHFLEEKGCLVVGVEQVRETAIFDDALAQSHAVVHLAAISGIPACEAHPQEAWEANVGQSLRLLTRCSIQSPAPRVILASSMAVVSETPSVYGRTKAALEYLGVSSYETLGLPVVILRFANVYGPYSWEKTSLVASYCRAALEARPLIVEGTGRQVRDFVHVVDICDAIWHAIRVPGAVGKTLSIGGPAPRSVREVADIMAGLTGGGLQFNPRRPNDPERVVADFTEAREILQWRPTIELEKGLPATWRWFQKEAEKRCVSLSQALTVTSVGP